MADEAANGVELGRDFPLVCESCLGTNPYVRMTRRDNAAICVISNRPCTVFRWSVGPGKFRSTRVAYDVAAAKNICQVCMTDLAFGLPMAVRDAFLKSLGANAAAFRAAAAAAAAAAGGSAAAGDDVSDAVRMLESTPTSQVGKDYQLALMEKRAFADPEAFAEKRSAAVDKAVRAVVQGAEFHAKRGGLVEDVDGVVRTPTLRLPRLCSDWLNGSCLKLRAKQCPYRPCCGAVAFPELDDEAVQRAALEDEIKALGLDRFDVRTWDSAVVRKLRKAAAAEREQHKAQDGKAHHHHSHPHEQQAVPTVYVSKLPSAVVASDAQLESAVREAFSGFGEIARVAPLREKSGAFVEFTSVDDAQRAVDGASGVVVGGVRGKVRVAFAKVKGVVSSTSSSTEAAAEAAATVAPTNPPSEEREENRPAQPKSKRARAASATEEPAKTAAPAPAAAAAVPQFLLDAFRQAS